MVSVSQLSCKLVSVCLHVCSPADTPTQTIVDYIMSSTCLWKSAAWWLAVAGTQFTEEILLRLSPSVKVEAQIIIISH